MQRDEIWNALYMYNRQILTYMARQESLTRVEKLLLKSAEEFLGLMEDAQGTTIFLSGFKLKVLPGGKG